MNADYKSIVLAISLFFALSTSISAAPGDLDSTFGSAGIVITSITNAPYYDVPRSIQVQPDGKIVVCGEIREDDSSQNATTVSFFLARYYPNGTLDTSFGTNGKIVAPINSGGELVGEEIALQQDGKIIAVGVSGSGNEFAVNRYNSDGTLDASFGTDGKVVTQVGNASSSYAKSVTVQPDGKIVVVGFGILDTYGGFAVVRYNPNGSLDTGFGNGGKIITLGSNNGDIALAVMLQPDGKIVVAGRGHNNNFSYPNDFALVRYNTDGSLDSGFGVSGKVVQTFPNASASLTDAVLQPDGKIVVSGYILSANPPALAIVRYNANGSVDTSFAANGIFTSTFFMGDGIALQPDGKIVSFGQVYFAVSTALRLNPNGAPDTGFGSNGVATTNLGSSYGLAGAIQPNGRILFLGYTWIGGDIVIARFLGDAIACPNPIDCNEFFVRQHYQDFLNREPDPAGLAFWTNEITSCGGEPQCVELKRINVSASFFLSIEFQQTGYFIYRMYKAAYGDMPGAPVPLTRQEFLPDTRLIGQGVVVGTSGWELALENNKNSFASDFVARTGFTTSFPTGMTAEQFVDALNANAGGVLSQTERNLLVSQLMSGTKTRAQILRAVAENTELARNEFNKAFVLMQYFGYLRRNPNDLPDTNFAGYNFWLNKLNHFNGDFAAAEMVKAFISSGEYHQRFGP